MKIAVDGIVLAAGLSVRMGEPKLLMKLGGRPIIWNVLTAAVDSRLSRVIVVTGPRGDEIREVLPEPVSSDRVMHAANPHPEKGMSSSLIAGLREVDPEASAVMIVLGDQPWLSHRVINELIDTFAAEPDKIVIPTIEGRRTTPVVFPASLLDELKHVTGDVGGRDVVKRHEEMVFAVEMGTFYNDTDIDTPEDLRNAEAGTRIHGKARDK